MEALWLILGLVVGAAAAVVALWPRLIRSRAELEHERARAEERLATVNDAQERLSASFKALSAEALQSSMSQLSELARAQLRAAQAEAKGDLDKRQRRRRAARGAAEGAARPRRRPAAAPGPGAPRVPRAPRGAAADAGRDRRAAAHRDGRAGHRAAQAQRPRPVGPDAAAQRGRARRDGPLLRLRRAVLAGRRRGGAAPGPGRQPARRQARRGRRQGAAAGRAGRLPGARRGGAPAATCAITRGCCASTSRRSPTRPTGPGSTPRPTSS